MRPWSTSRLRRWPVDFASYSPAAALEWRGHMTVHALSILKRNSMI